jgi:hypothetical protein
MKKCERQPLAAADVALLRFEQRWPGPSWAKTTKLRPELGLTMARYQQRLTALMADPRAVEAFPDVCSAVLRRRAQEEERRASRSF